MAENGKEATTRTDSGVGDNEVAGDGLMEPSDDCEIVDNSMSKMQSDEEEEEPECEPPNNLEDALVQINFLTQVRELEIQIFLAGQSTHMDMVP